VARGWGLVEKARRLLLQEEGAVVREWGGRLPLALVFPNAYFVGMSSLGFQAVYGLLNGLGDVVCERAFLNLGRSSGGDIEALSLESQRPLRDFPVIAFSLSYELDYPNVVRILQDAGIPPLAAERQGRPLVIAGGPAVSANPLPMAPVVDAVLIGELEEATGDLANALWQALEAEQPAEVLAEVPGLYVPSRHRQPGAVSRRWTKRLDDWRTCTVVGTRFTEFAGMHLVEMARGCARGCRFCLAGHVYRPVRERSADKVLEMAMEGVDAGHTIGLLAPSLSDTRGLRPVLRHLLDAGARVSVSSLRADSLDDDLMRDLIAAGNDTLTIAPEAGCPRLRQAIGKDLSNEDVLAAAALAEKHGLKELKLYFMIGLPGETEDDVVAAAELVRQVREVFSRKLVANVSCFVPKPNTPFQWQPFAPVGELEARLRRFEAELHGSGVQVRADSPRWALLQALFARGDERAGLALVQTGDFGRKGLLSAIERAGVDIKGAVGPRQVGEPLPWDVVGSGLPPAYLEGRSGLGSEE